MERTTLVHDSSPSRSPQGCPGKLSISEEKLVRVEVGPGPGGIDLRRLVDAGDRFAQEEGEADELSEADRRHGKAMQARGDAQQEEGDHGGQDLQANGVVGASDEAADIEMLLDPSEQQLDLPSGLIEGGDLDGGPRHVVGQQFEGLAALMAAHADEAQADVELGIAFADQLDLGILEHGEAIAVTSPPGPQALGAEAGVGLAAGDEVGVGLIDLGPPAIVTIGLVKNVSRRCLDRHLAAEADVAVERWSDRLAVRNVGLRVVDDVQLQAPYASIPLRPLDHLAERDRRRIDQSDHLLTLAPPRPGSLSGQTAEQLGEDRHRSPLVGIRQCRSAEFANPQVIVVVGVGLPSCFQLAQALGAAQLSADQTHQMVPAIKLLVVGIAIVTIHNGVELPSIYQFEQAAKNAIAITHAWSFYFLSLSNLKVADLCRRGRACACVTSNHSPDNPAEPAKGRCPHSACPERSRRGGGVMSTITDTHDPRAPVKARSRRKTPP